MVRYIILLLLSTLASVEAFAQREYWKAWIDTMVVFGKPSLGSLTEENRIEQANFCNIRTSSKDKTLEETGRDDWIEMLFEVYCTSDTTVGLATGEVYIYVDGKGKLAYASIDRSGYDFILKIPELAKVNGGSRLKVNRLDSWSFAEVADLVKGIVIPKSVSYINPRIMYDARYAEKISVEDGSPYFSNYKGICLYDATGTTLLVCPYRGSYGKYFKDGIAAIGPDAFSHHYTFGNNDLSLPETIKKIGDRAFYGCRLNRIEIPDACEEIGPEAFGGDMWYDCDTLFLGRGLRKIGYHAFSFNKWYSRISGDKCIVCKAVTPPEARDEGSDPFGLYAKKSIKLLVPEGSVEAYRNHWVWGQFNVIGDAALNPVEVEPDDPTSVSDPEAGGLRVRVDGRDILFDGETDVEVFTLGGLRLYAGRTASLSIASPGIYLVSAGGGSAKVQIR